MQMSGIGVNFWDLRPVYILEGMMIRVGANHQAYLGQPQDALVCQHEIATYINKNPKLTCFSKVVVLHYTTSRLDFHIIACFTFFGLPRCI